MAPSLLLVGMVLRWVYFRSYKKRSTRRWTSTYSTKLGGEARRELLRLYSQVEKLLRRKSGIHRKPWQTVGDFAGVAGATDPRANLS